jgi:hypothetical protein
MSDDKLHLSQMRSAPKVPRVLPRVSPPAQPTATATPPAQFAEGTNRAQPLAEETRTKSTTVAPAVPSPAGTVIARSTQRSEVAQGSVARPRPMPTKRASSPRATIIPITRATSRSEAQAAPGDEHITSVNVRPADPGIGESTKLGTAISMSALATGWDANATAQPQSFSATQERAPARGAATAAAVAAAPRFEPVVEPLPLPPPPAPLVASPAPASPVFEAPFAPAFEATHAAPLAAPVVDQRWALFEKLGLGENKQLSQQSAKFLVSTYRLLGFAVLTIIVVVLCGYIATSAFYFVSDSWVQPMVVSKTDERVLQLEAQVAALAGDRDKTAAELNHTDRSIAMQQEFQAQFAAAIKADLEDRKATLSRVRELAKDYAGARSRVASSNRAVANISSKQMKQEYAAGLIDRSGLISSKQQIAALNSSSLSLAERQAEYESRAAALTAEARGLDAIISNSGGKAALSYDVLRIKQEYEMSRLETAKALEARQALVANLARQDAMLASLEASPMLRAADGQSNVAFVPYSNLDDVAVGDGVYGCALEMIFCGKVGSVAEILPGEVVFKHPQRDKALRGRMVQLKLDQADAAEDDVLFVGRPPLLL